MREPRTLRTVVVPKLPQLRLFTPSADLPGFELSFVCSGRTYKAFARGRNAQAAAHEALIDLASACPDFEPETARLVRAVQTQ